MRPFLNLEKRDRLWVVSFRSGRIEYSDSCYAKAVGVFEYLQSRKEAQDAAAKKDA